MEDAQNGLALDTYAPIDETRDCALTDITVTFANSGLFDAEWLTCSLVPGAGDVALYAQSDIKLDVAARSQAQLTLAGTHAGRRRGAGARCGILRAGHAAHDDRAAGRLKEAPGD